LAELEIRHSRAAVPTRRVALGPQWLPTTPAPGFGGILLAGIVAAHVKALDDELRSELDDLIDDLDNGRRIPQPRLRYRFQTDTVGLDRSRHRLVGHGDEVEFDIDRHGHSVPQVLAAVYAAGQAHEDCRQALLMAVRVAIVWDGPLGPGLINRLTDPIAAAPPSWRRLPIDERWALQVLGFGPDMSPDPDDVRRRFRSLVSDAHPDRGAEVANAGRRILELTEARRVLLLNADAADPVDQVTRGSASGR